MLLRRYVKCDWELLLREGFHDCDIPAVVLGGRFSPGRLTQGCWEYLLTPNELKSRGGRRTTNKTQTKRENQRPQSSFRTSILSVEAGSGCGTRGRPRAQWGLLPAPLRAAGGKPPSGEACIVLLRQWKKLSTRRRVCSLQTKIHPALRGQGLFLVPNGWAERLEVLDTVSWLAWGRESRCVCVCPCVPKAERGAERLKLAARGGKWEREGGLGWGEGRRGEKSPSKPGEQSGLMSCLSPQPPRFLCRRRLC